MLGRQDLPLLPGQALELPAPLHGRCLLDQLGPEGPANLIEQPGRGLVSTPGFRSGCLTVATPEALIIQGQTRMNVVAVSTNDGSLLWTKKKFTNNPNAIYLDGKVVAGRRDARCSCRGGSRDRRGLGRIQFPQSGLHATDGLPRFPVRARRRHAAIRSRDEESADRWCRSPACHRRCDSRKRPALPRPVGMRLQPLADRRNGQVLGRRLSISTSSHNAERAAARRRRYHSPSRLPETRA